MHLVECLPFVVPLVIIIPLVVRQMIECFPTPPTPPNLSNTVFLVVKKLVSNNEVLGVFTDVLSAKRAAIQSFFDNFIFSTVDPSKRYHHVHKKTEVVDMWKYYANNEYFVEEWTLDFYGRDEGIVSRMRLVLDDHLKNKVVEDDLNTQELYVLVSAWKHLPPDHLYELFVYEREDNAPRYVWSHELDIMREKWESKHDGYHNHYLVSRK